MADLCNKSFRIWNDIKTLSEILDHANAIITLNRYAPSMMNYKIMIMNKLGKLLA